MLLLSDKIESFAQQNINISSYQITLHDICGRSLPQTARTTALGLSPRELDEKKVK